MSVTAEWLDEEKTIACYEFSFPWTWGEFYTTRSAIREQVRQMTHMVDFIGDFSGDRGILPPSFITNIRNSVESLPPNSGVIVIISPRPSLAKTFINVVTKLVRRNDIFFAHDMDAAKAIIAAVRQRREAEKQPAD